MKVEPYKAFLINFNSFKEANDHPVALEFDDIDVDTLVVNNASWYKSVPPEVQQL